MLAGAATTGCAGRYRDRRGGDFFDGVGLCRILSNGGDRIGQGPLAVVEHGEGGARRTEGGVSGFVNNCRIVSKAVEWTAVVFETVRKFDSCRSMQIG